MTKYASTDGESGVHYSVDEKSVFSEILLWKRRELQESKQKRGENTDHRPDIELFCRNYTRALGPRRQLQESKQKRGDNTDHRPDIELARGNFLRVHSVRLSDCSASSELMVKSEEQKQ
jgi:hypothetical protein